MKARPVLRPIYGNLPAENLSQIDRFKLEICEILQPSLFLDRSLLVPTFERINAAFRGLAPWIDFWTPSQPRSD